MAKILDNILCSALVYLLTFCWTVYCLKDVQLALILATVVALAASYIIYSLLKRAETKRNTRKKYKQTLKNFATFLQFNSDNSALFMPMFCYYNYIATPINYDNIVITKNKHYCNKNSGSGSETGAAETGNNGALLANNFAHNKRTYVSLYFETDSVSLAQIQAAVVAAKRENCQELMIFGNKISADLLALANSQIPTKFVDTANTYELLEHADKLPTIPTVSAPKPRIVPQFAFNRKRFLWYFFGAVYNLVLSFFSYFKLYLLVWATVMFCLAVYSLVNRKYNQKPTNFKLE